MLWILLQYHDGNSPSKHHKQESRAGATRSREAHLIRLDGHRDDQVVTEIKHWIPMPLSKLHTNPLREPITRTRVPLAVRIWQALPMHPQRSLLHHRLLRINRVGGTNEDSNHNKAAHQ